MTTLSHYLQIDSQYLIDNSSVTPSSENNHQATTWSAQNSRYSPQLKQVDRILIYMLAFPAVIQALDDIEISTLSTLSPLVNQLIQVIYNSNLQQTPMGVLIENWRDTNDYETLKKYLVWETPLNRDEIEQEIKQIIQKLQQQEITTQWLALQQKMKLYGESGLSDAEKKRYLELIYQRKA